MPIAAPLIIAGGTVAAGMISADAAKSAASKQSDAAANALGLQQQMYNQTQQNIQQNFKPYLDVGQGATYTLGGMYGIGPNATSPGQQDFSQFTNSPDYAFAQQQGELGLTRAENARGLNLSGGALKDISQFNQGLATQQFGNYYNRLLSLSQLGGQAASGASNAEAGLAQNFSGQMSNSIQGQGQAQASGIVGGANAITGGINSGITNSLLYNAINRSSYAGANPLGQGTSFTPQTYSGGTSGLY